MEDQEIYRKAIRVLHRVVSLAGMPEMEKLEAWKKTVREAEEVVAAYHGERE